MTNEPDHWAIRRWIFDISGAIVLSAVLVVVSGHLHAHGGMRSIDGLAYGLLVVAGLSMTFWRRAPAIALTVVIIVFGVYVARHYVNGPMLGMGWIALLALSVRASRRTALLSAAALCVVLGVATVIADRFTLLPVAYVGWSAAAVFLGDALRSRRTYLSELEERARFLEHTREEEARRRVAEDRLRIARDLHDSVAHAMATITVQAGAAAHVMDQRPDAAKAALAAIQRASGDVLDELGAMLTVLRDDGETAERAPTPGIDQVGHLVEAARATGVDVCLVVDGPIGELPATVGTAAYRIVQESLTNVIRHSGGSSAAVTVRAGDGRSLSLEIRDNGTGQAAESVGSGIGIRGMRERAESTSGRFTAGREADGGFLVRAIWEPRS